MRNAYLASFALTRHPSRVAKTKPAYHIVGSVLCSVFSVHCILSMSRIVTSICSQEPFIYPRILSINRHMHAEYRMLFAIHYSLFAAQCCILLLICRHERCLIASIHCSDREYFNVCLYQSVVSFQTCYYIEQSRQTKEKK